MINNNFFLIAGPCVVENREVTELVAKTVSQICNELSIPFYFKASYKKLIAIFRFIYRDRQRKHCRFWHIHQGKENVPIVTDVHTEEKLR